MVLIDNTKALSLNSSRNLPILTLDESAVKSIAEMRCSQAQNSFLGGFRVAVRPRQLVLLSWSSPPRKDFLMFTHLLPRGQPAHPDQSKSIISTSHMKGVCHELPHIN